LPVLTEDDWELMLTNVSITTFVQNIPIGLKYYNNYTVATSTNNNEFVNKDGIYLSDIDRRSTDEYYHMPYCEKLESTDLIGYKNTDYVIESYDIEETGGATSKGYYYKHSNIANKSCYYCLVQRSLFNDEGLDEGEKEDHNKAKETAIARERYVSREFR